MNDHRNTLLLAKWVCPMDRPPIRDGGVAIVGERIAAVGSAKELRERFIGAKVIDYGDAALLPGLINAHTHLELTNRPRIEFDGDIAGWLLRQRPPAGLTPEQHRAEVENATRAGIEQCLRFGVTCIGDISQQPQWTRPILANSPLRATSFGEVLGLGKLRVRTTAMIERAMSRECRSPLLTVGISPHAPYTVEASTLRASVITAFAERMPLTMHLSEFAEEADFLLKRSGPFRSLWEQAGLWDESAEIPASRPIELADEFGLLSAAWILAHVNYVSDADIALLSRGVASVVFCPRTHAYFRHESHRWRDMIVAGVNVAIGTDSCASSPDLNIVDDLRLLHRQYLEEPAEKLWSLVTTRAAAALDRAEVGSLTARKMADVVVFAVKGSEPLVEILEGGHGVSDLWIGGVRQSEELMAW